MFLKAPVAFKYITSGFTTGLRYVAAFNTATGHRAIDYAAKTGTPIRATAAGVVSFAGWDGPYGNKVSIRHNSVYTTNYAHQSRMAVRRGQSVSQGQIIGYVGSTGFSTGPHLHYEMVKNGTKINPLREEFPGTDPVKAEEKPAFDEVVRSWAGRL
jgi:murein DD-endopeptidase MepM/ murein hydrolase activator NlpD